MKLKFNYLIAGIICFLLFSWFSTLFNNSILVNICILMSMIGLMLGLSDFVKYSFLGGDINET